VASREQFPGRPFVPLNVGCAQSHACRPNYRVGAREYLQAEGRRRLVNERLWRFSVSGISPTWHEQTKPKSVRQTQAGSLSQ
jgi:hypothetical protein